jgi:hypothetical protein
VAQRRGSDITHIVLPAGDANLCWSHSSPYDPGQSGFNHVLVSFLHYIVVFVFFLLCLPIFSIRTLWSLARTRYLQHPNEKVNSASHSVMVSFLPSSTDTDQDDQTSLKEQLAFYYIKRSLEVVHAKYCFVIFGS